MRHRGQWALTIEGHVFDEAHLQRLFLRQRHKIEQLILIKASHDHTVNLQRAAQNNTDYYLIYLNCKNAKFKTKTTQQRDILVTTPNCTNKNDFLKDAQINI